MEKVSGVHIIRMEASVSDELEISELYLDLTMRQVHNLHSLELRSVPWYEGRATRKPISSPVYDGYLAIDCLCCQDRWRLERQPTQRSQRA